MKKEKKIEMIDYLRVDKKGRIYDCYGNWIGTEWKTIMSKKDAERFWGKRKELSPSLTRRLLTKEINL